MNSNTTEVDELWNSFDSDRGWVSLPHTWAAKNDISEGLPLPDAPEMGLFILDGYHQMHCLVSLQAFDHILATYFM
jgi:hypothetical protein